MNQAEFYKKLVELVEAGDEAAARKYLSEHILEFPLDVQDSLLFAFFNEALQSHAEDETNIQKFQENGADALKHLMHAQKEVDNVVRIDELKEQLAK